MARLEDKPVNGFVRVHAPRGQARNVSSARQAAEWLLFRWPQEIDTAKAHAARKTYALRFWEGQREAAAARKAFSEAAEEAGILIGDVRITPKPVKKRRR